MEVRIINFAASHTVCLGGEIPETPVAGACKYELNLSNVIYIKLFFGSQ